MNSLPLGLISEITSHFDYVADLSVFRRTCKAFLVIKLTARKHDNSLAILINLYPNKKWNWGKISRNPHITKKLFENNINKIKETYGLCCNSDIDVEIIKRYPQLKWRFDILPSHSHLTWDDFKAIIEDNQGGIMLPRDFWEYLSCHECVTFEIVQAHPGYYWNKERVSSNRNITFETIKNNPGYRWGSFGVSCNPNVTFETIKNNPDFPWNWSGVSLNPNVTLEIMFDNLDKPWDWNYAFVSQPHLNDELLDKIAKYVKDDGIWWNQLTRHPDVTFDMVKAHPNIPWCRYTISSHKNVTWETIKNNSDYEWDPDYVSRNPNITWKIYIENRDYPWDEEGIYTNIVNWEIVRDNPDYKWKMRYLSMI